jgi:proteic killer suppression protein
MRFAFRDRDLQSLFQTGGSPRLHPSVVSAFFRTMALIAQAQDIRDIRAIKGRRMEQLKGDREGQYSVRLNEQFRLIFSIERDEAGNYLLIIEIVDYH